MSRFAVRPQFDWRLRTRSLALGPRTLIMGILNATPDSFSDGGQFPRSPRSAHPRAPDARRRRRHPRPRRRIHAPQLHAHHAAEEQARVLPILRAVLAARPDAILSIDTYHAETARLAIESGAEIVNDVSGFLWDEAMAATCASLACGTIIMHTRGRPHQWRTLPALAPDEVLRSSSANSAPAVKQRSPQASHMTSIVLDPGFGFGKAFDENFPLLAHLDALHALGFPLLAGLSRKGFLRHALADNRPARQDSGAIHNSIREVRQDATTAANTAAILAGAHILRVHEVRPARAAAAIADRILAAR